MPFPFSLFVFLSAIHMLCSHMTTQNKVPLWPDFRFVRLPSPISDPIHEGRIRFCDRFHEEDTIIPNNRISVRIYLEFLHTTAPRKVDHPRKVSGWDGKLPGEKRFFPGSCFMDFLDHIELSWTPWTPEPWAPCMRYMTEAFLTKPNILTIYVTVVVFLIL